MFIIVGKEVTRACSTDQLCSGIEAGMEGEIHYIRLLWDAHKDDED